MQIAAFQQPNQRIPQKGEYGTAPPNPLVGPCLSTFDCSLTKSLRMPWSEGHELMFQTAFFNAFNSPQFGQAGGMLGAGRSAVSPAQGLTTGGFNWRCKYSF